MNRTSLVEKLKTIVQPYSNNQEAVGTLTEDTDFIRDLGINSANLVDIVLDIEEQFGITVDNADMEQMLTVKASLDIIENKLSGTE